MPDSDRVWETGGRSAPFVWDTTGSLSILDRAPAETPGVPKTTDGGPTIWVPSPGGDRLGFRVVESPLMDEPLAATYSGIRTYRGQGMVAGSRSSTLRLVRTPYGLDAQVLFSSGSFEVRPSGLADGATPGTYVIHVHGPGASQNPTAIREGIRRHTPQLRSPPPSRVILRTYRLAVAASSGWIEAATARIPDVIPTGVPDSLEAKAPPRQKAMVALVVAVSRVTGIFERELGVRFLLVNGTQDLLPPDGDPYARETRWSVVKGIQRRLLEGGTSFPGIDDSAFDIGHVFRRSVSGGGLSGIGVAGTRLKAVGVTGWHKISDQAAIDLFAHELGHQLGAHHTIGMRGTGRNGPTAWEPGSGSTIMAYAGRCPREENIQWWSDPYFHAGSLEEIRGFIESSPRPTFEVETSNRTPRIGAPARPLAVPPDTPFLLRATGVSGETGEELTFTFEEMDAAQCSSEGSETDPALPPSFRSLPPTLNPERAFPGIRQASPGVVARFREAVRDNRSDGGGVAWVDVNVTVRGSVPLRVDVSDPGTAEDGARGTGLSLTWTAEALNACGVTQVRILLEDDEANALIPLLEQAPNSGVAAVVLPEPRPNEARIRVESLGMDGLTIFAISPTFRP